MKTFHFTREFTSGLLMGIQHEDKISFPNLKMFHNFVESINKANKETSLNYRIVSFDAE
jgi:hypothetical protein